MRSRQEYLDHCQASNVRILNSPAHKSRVRYVRDRNGNPNAVLFASLHLPTGKVYFGWSARNAKREKRAFNKSEGLHKAMNRAFSNDSGFVPRRICNEYDAFVVKTLNFAEKHEKVTS